MKNALVLAAALAAIIPSLADTAAVKAARSYALLAEASLPSPGGHDTAVLADAESNGATGAGRDTAMV